MALAGYLLAKKVDGAKYEIFVEQAKAKAKAIEHEAEILLKNAKNALKTKEIALKEESDKKFSELKEALDKRTREIEKEEMILDQQKSANESLSMSLEKEKKELQKELQQNSKLKKRYLERLKEAEKLVENGAGLTKEEAKAIILSQAKENAREEMAHIMRKSLKEAEKNAKKEAFWVIAQATTRFVGEFAGERLINVVNIRDDDIKGKVIGKDGKNIKALEMALGVDIIIDDTPNSITVSNFNIYRRQIAVATLEKLIDDGRIHPAKIEEVHEAVKAEFETQIFQQGEEVLMEMGLGSAGISDEITKLIGRLKYRASYGQNALGHSIEVAHLAGMMSAEMGGDELLAKRAGLLHDIGKALTQEFSGSHVDLGYELCKRHNEPDAVLNGIRAHHGHEEAKSIEAAAVCAADTLSAARPGARREVLESFLKRVKAIEEIATSNEAVKMAYAINAGREVRVIVEATLVNDNEASLIGQEVAKEIEANVSYPGEVKVTVIRETRSVSYAS